MTPMASAQAQCEMVRVTGRLPGFLHLVFARRVLSAPKVVGGTHSFSGRIERVAGSRSSEKDRSADVVRLRRPDDDDRQQRDPHFYKATSNRKLARGRGDPAICYERSCGDNFNNSANCSSSFVSSFLDFSSFPQPGKRTDKQPRGGAPPRSEIAGATGISKDQQVTAMRLPSLP